MVALNDSLADLPYWPHGETWCLGDEGVICALLEDRERRGGYREVAAPWIDSDMRYLPGNSPRLIRVYESMDVRLDLEDLYAKLQINYRSQCICPLPPSSLRSWEEHSPGSA